MSKTQRVKAKIVPNRQPNAPGDWRVFTVPYQKTYSFGTMAHLVGDQLDEEHMVSYELID